MTVMQEVYFNPLNTKLNPICHLLALLGAHHILHVSRIRVNVSPDGGNFLQTARFFLKWLKNPVTSQNRNMS